jgi:hypothetical protein
MMLPTNNVTTATTDAGQVPPGIVVWASLDEQISLASARVGQTFTARLTQPIKVSPNGRTLVPKGARLAGQIVGLQVASDDSPAMVRLAITSIEMDDKQQDLRARIIKTQVPPPPRGRMVHADGGMLVGGIVTDQRQLVAGGKMADARGTTIALGNSDARLTNLPKGTGLALRLDGPLEPLPR